MLKKKIHVSILVRGSEPLCANTRLTAGWQKPEWLIYSSASSSSSSSLRQTVGRPWAPRTDSNSRGWGKKKKDDLRTIVALQECCWDTLRRAWVPRTTFTRVIKGVAATKASSPKDGLLFDYCLELISGYICLISISGSIPTPPILCEKRDNSHSSSTLLRASLLSLSPHCYIWLCANKRQLHMARC